MGSPLRRSDLEAEYCEVPSAVISGDMIIAASGNDVRKMRALITSNYDINAQDNRGWTPLHAAASSSSVDCVRLLLSQPNIDRDHRNYEGDTALHLACRSNTYETVRLLVEGSCNLDVANKYGNRPLLLACGVRSKAVADLLIGAGADVHSADSCGDSPLHMAVYHNNVGLTVQLMDMGADFTLKNENKMTPFMMALARGCEEISELLIDLDQDPDARYVDGWTPLMHALNRGYDYVISRLLDMGANVNVVAEGVTPLHLACALGNPDVFNDIFDTIDRRIVFQKDVLNLCEFVLQKSYAPLLPCTLHKLFTELTPKELMFNAKSHLFGDLFLSMCQTDFPTAEIEGIVYCLAAKGISLPRSLFHIFLRNYTGSNSLDLFHALLDIGMNLDARMAHPGVPSSFTIVLRRNICFLPYVVENSIQLDMKAAAKYAVRKVASPEVWSVLYDKITWFNQLYATIGSDERYLGVLESLAEVRNNRKEVDECLEDAVPPLFKQCRDRVRKILATSCESTFAFRMALATLNLPDSVKDLIRLKGPHSVYFDKP